ncbi:hypothetical protein QL285_079918 [Trifolium repens]|nr:hypothetical protein QL285_079918 [Trifolium repens]
MRIHFPLGFVIFKAQHGEITTFWQSEIDVLTKEVAEVNELKAKVAEFDAMKEQFAVIMANMQNHGSNIGSPFEVRRSSESSHNVEGDQATPDD